MGWNPLLSAFEVFGLAMEIHFFGTVTLVIAFFLYRRYIRAMKRGEIEPPRSTWFLWLLLDIVAFGGRLADHTFDTLLFAYTVGTAIVAFYTLWYGKGGWTKTESLCAAAVIVSVILWLVIGPKAALVCSLFGMTVATYPLLQGVLAGKREDRTTWLLAVGTSVSNLFDGQVFVSIWLGLLQLVIVFAITRNLRKFPEQIQRGDQR